SLYALPIPLFYPSPWCHSSFSHSTPYQCLCSVLVRVAILRFLNLRAVSALFCPCPYCRPLFSHSAPCNAFVLSLSVLSSFIFPFMPCEFLCSAIARFAVVRSVHLRLANSLVLPLYAMMLFI